MTCEKCKGDGRGIDNGRWVACDNCKGSGEQPVAESVVETVGAENPEWPAITADPIETPSPDAPIAQAEALADPETDKSKGKAQKGKAQ